MIFHNSRYEKIVNLLKFLYLQRVVGLTPPTEPHFDKESGIWFKNQLPKSRYYLEYGSGGSTVFAASLGIRVTSVESDPYYAKAVTKVIPPSRQINMLTPRLGLTGEWGWPVFKNPKKGMRYATAPFAEGTKEFPDFVLVDGRYRVACALEVAQRANIEGHSTTIMFDDYTSRPEYHEIEKLLGAPVKIGRAAIFVVGAQKIPGDVLKSQYADAS